MLVALLLLLGYALDSADGQVARLTGTGSPAGEWLDHVVDATKIASPPAGAPGRACTGAETVDVPWLVVPLVHAVVGSVLFFAMILTEQLRRARGTASVAATSGRLPWLRSVLVVPTDYGVLCLVFLLLAAPTVFFVAYTAIVACTTVFLVAAAARWFREISG